MTVRRAQLLRGSIKSLLSLMAFIWISLPSLHTYKIHVSCECVIIILLDNFFFFFIHLPEGNIKLRASRLVGIKKKKKKNLFFTYVSNTAQLASICCCSRLNSSLSMTRSGFFLSCQNWKATFSTTIMQKTCIALLLMELMREKNVLNSPSTFPDKQPALRKTSRLSTRCLSVRLLSSMQIFHKCRKNNDGQQAGAARLCHNSRLTVGLCFETCRTQTLTAPTLLQSWSRLSLDRVEGFVGPRDLRPTSESSRFPYIHFSSPHFLFPIGFFVIIFHYFLVWQRNRPSWML